LLGSVSLCVAQDFTTNDPLQQMVLAQQQENKAAQAAAVKLEADLVNAGNQAFQAKDFAAAADDYRRALNITYDAWEFRTISAGGMQTVQPSNYKVRLKLSTQNTRTALDRLNAIPGAAAAEDQATAQKEMKTLFDQADAAMKAKNLAEAYQAYEGIIAIAADQGDKKFATDSATKAQDAEKKILADVGKRLDEVQKAITGGNVDDASAKLASFRNDYAALIAVAADLKKRLDQLQASPEIKKELQEREVQRQIQVGDLALLREDYAIAARYYRKAAMLYPGTAAAAAATEKLSQLQADPKAAAALKQEEAETKCQSLIQHAEKMLKAKKFDEAKADCQKIVAEYPNTTCVERAKEILKACAQ